jgi:hypothetical protein
LNSGGGADGFDDGAVVGEWSSAPVARDKREETVLDLVPFAGARREMEDNDGQSQLVRQFLEFNLPEAHAGSVASATVGGDRQSMGVGVAMAPHGGPPGAYRVDREGGGVVVDADTDPPFVGGDVIDAIGRGAAELRVDEVADADRLG